MLLSAGGASHGCPCVGCVVLKRFHSMGSICSVFGAGSSSLIGTLPDFSASIHHSSLFAGQGLQTEDMTGIQSHKRNCSAGLAS
jgi:hypothetical protein